MNSALIALKSLPGLIQPSAIPEHFPFSLLNRGFPKSSLIEVSGALGSGKTEVILQFLKENPSLQVAWIEEELTIYPCSFLQKNIALERVLFAVPTQEKDALWIAHQVLRSQTFQVVVLSQSLFQDSSSSQFFDETELRRLQLLAQRSQALVILISEEPTREKSWPISLQIHVSRCIQTDAPEIEIIKAKGCL